MRYILPFILKKVLQRYQQKFFDQHRQHSDEPKRKAGKVYVEQVPDDQKINLNDGEYIDYEEIKEK